MKNLKRLNRAELKNVSGGVDPSKGCLPCEIYCSYPAGERPSCKIVYIVEHCNGCKGWETV